MATIPLVGGSYQSASVAADAQRTLNWYPEQIESGSGKAPAVFYPTPGLRAIGGMGATSVPGPWRGLYATGDQFTVGVLQNQLYELGLGPERPLLRVSPTVRGTVAIDQTPCTFADNGRQGHQVLLSSAGHLYGLDTISRAFTEVVPTQTGPWIAVAYIDGYFLACNPTGFEVSKLMDGTQWPGMAAVRSEGADPVVTMIQNHRELWLLGTLTSEVWYDTGAADFPFAPIPGVFLQFGCVAPYSVCRLDQTVAWLARSADGDRIAILINQYTPNRVSTHAVEEMWRTYATVADAQSTVYQEAGHTFWVIRFPTADATWVYDAATQVWHERSWWDPKTATWHAHRSLGHAWTGDVHLVGDPKTTQLYALDSRLAYDQLPEGDTMIRRVRRVPHLAQENHLTRYHTLELELEMGLGLPVGQGQHPQAMLRWSDDRAHTWSPEWWVDASPMGTYSARARWWRLGQTRDRVFEIGVSDPIPWRLLAAYVTASGGTS